MWWSGLKMWWFHLNIQKKYSIMIKMSKPTDINLYNQIKEKVFKEIPKHSAYRSGILVRRYKEAFFKKHGNNISYRGNKKENEGLSRWFKEDWKNQRGQSGYQKKGDIYRPTKRITN